MPEGLKAVNLSYIIWVYESLQGEHMWSKVFYALAYGLIFLGGYVMFFGEKATFLTLCFSAIYFGLSMAFFWFGMKMAWREREKAMDMERALERRKDDKDLLEVLRLLSSDYFELRDKNELVMLETQVKLRTTRGNVETYNLSDFNLEVKGRFRVYKNEVVAFVFHELLKTNGFYFIKTRV